MKYCLICMVVILILMFIAICYLFEEMRKVYDIAIKNEDLRTIDEHILEEIALENRRQIMCALIDKKEE